jgi:hypothetical protein
LLLPPLLLLLLLLAAAVGCCCCCVPQRLRDVHADALMGIALPMADSDSCGCVLSGLLGGVPFIDINGHPMVDAPITVPQVGYQGKRVDVIDIAICETKQVAALC